MQIGDDQKQKDFLLKYQNVNRKMEEQQAAKQALALGLEYIDLSAFPVDLNALAIFTEQQSADAQSVIFYKEGNDLRVGTVQPTNEIFLRLSDELTKKKFQLKLYYISESSLKQLQSLYSKVAKPKEIEEDIVRIGKDRDYINELKTLEDESKTFSATQILEMLLGAADKYKASDIHIEPEDHLIKVRFRLDGVLSDVLHLPKIYQSSVISRIKILSKLKLNVQDVPQDGRFTYDLLGHLTDVRVSLLPSAYGEGVVMRLLATQAVSLKLADLGFIGHSSEAIAKQIAKPNGMIITTGPTGSGKTTTLYAFLNQLNEPGVKIITLEDPVEYKLEGISQTPISADKGMTFASGLRAILRQDPDVIMVGEIRDQETAEVALQAALTGHIVLSTLHTNDAAGAIPRLLNMGVKPFVIAPAMNAIIAQRLVRRICPDCKQEVKLDPFMLEKVKNILKSIPKNSGLEIPAELKFYHGVGCDKCNHTGYKGRIGIYEVIEKTEAIEKLIFAEANTLEIKKIAVSEGMVTMIQDGMVKATMGITDVEEVLRVAQE